MTEPGPSAVGIPAPLPYSTQELGAHASGGFHLYLTDSNGRRIAAIWGPATEKVETADLVVRACNAHAAMLAVLERLSSTGIPDHVSNEVSKQMQNAIALARGEA